MKPSCRTTQDQQKMPVSRWKMAQQKNKFNSPAVKEAARLISIGRYSESNAEFDRESFRSAWHVPYMVVFGFIRRFNHREFQAIGGDTLLAMVAAEIWLYNMTRAVMAGHGAAPDSFNEPGRRKSILGKCNTFSIAQYLGISNATCRRKVLKLVEMGWVEMDAKKQLLITKKCEDAFDPKFNEETMADFISTARTLFEVLDLGLAANKPPSGTED